MKNSLRTVFWVGHFAILLSFIEGCKPKENNLSKSDSLQSKREELFDSMGSGQKVVFPAVRIDKSNTNGIIYDSVFSIVEQAGKKAYIQRTNILFAGYTISIVSNFLSDSISLEESNLFFPIPLKQNILFYKGDTLLSEIVYPAKRIFQKDTRGQNIEMLENVLMSAGIIKGSKGNVLVIGGYGGCNSCSELYGYYTLEGTELGINYRTKEKIYKKSIDLNLLISQFGLDRNELIRTKYSWVRIY